MSLGNILKICASNREATEEAKRISDLLPEWKYYGRHNILKKDDSRIYVTHLSGHTEDDLVGTYWDTLVISENVTGDWHQLLPRIKDVYAVPESVLEIVRGRNVT